MASRSPQHQHGLNAAQGRLSAMSSSRLTMGTAAYMLYHLMLLPVKLINLFDQSRIMDMEMVPLAPGLCSDPLLYSLLLSRLCGGHLLSKVAAGIQDTGTSGTAAYTSSMRRADLALDDNASTPYLPYLPPTCMHVHMLLPTSRVQGPVWCPRIYAASVSDAMWLTQVSVCVCLCACVCVCV